MSDRPLILALDTSHFKGSVAVARGREILCEMLFDASDTHSATLMPAVDICLKSARVTVKDMDLFALVEGPGSFTGLRIGLATIKAFAAINRRPVVSVSSMETLAAAFPYAARPILPLVDARRSEVYAAIYNSESGLPVEILGPCAVRPEKTGELLSGAGCKGPVIMCGTGAYKYRDLLSELLPEGSCFAPARWSYPSAGVVALLASGRAPVEYGDLPALEPLYIRPPDARLPADSKLRAGGGAG